MKYLCVYICLRHVIGIGDGVPTRVVNVDKIDFNGRAACCVAVALSVRFEFCVEKPGDFGDKSLESH